MSLLENLSEAGRIKVKLAVAIIGVFVCGTIVFRACDKPVNDAPSQAIRDTFDKRVLYYDSVIKTAQDSTLFYKELYNKQLSKVSIVERNLSIEKGKVLSLAAKVILTKKVTDTSEHSKQCDTLAQQIPVLVSQITDYKDEVDSLHLAHLKEREASEANISRLLDFNSQMRSSFASLEQVNKGLLIENKKLVKKSNNAKFLNRILAAGVTIAAGAIILK